MKKKIQTHQEIKTIIYILLFSIFNEHHETTLIKKEANKTLTLNWLNYWTDLDLKRKKALKTQNCTSFCSETSSFLRLN